MLGRIVLYSSKWKFNSFSLFLCAILITLIGAHTAFTAQWVYEGQGTSWTNIGGGGVYDGSVSVSITVSDVLVDYDGNEIVKAPEGWFDAGLGLFEINQWSIVGDAIGSHSGSGGGLYFEFWNPNNAPVSEGSMNYDGWLFGDQSDPSWGGDFRLYDSDLSFWEYGDQSDPHYGELSPVIWMNGSIYDDFRFGIDVYLSRVDQQPVPEPSTIMLIGLGLMGLSGYGRKKYRK